MVLIVGVLVDDLLIAGSSMEIIEKFIEKPSQKFKVKDMGKLHYFLGVKVNQKPGKIWIGQPTYTKEILEKINMKNSKPVATPVEQGTKLMKNALTKNYFSQPLEACCTYQQKQDPTSLLPLEM